MSQITLMTRTANIPYVLFGMLLFLAATESIAQTSIQDGSWQENNNWNATYPGAGTDADDVLNLDGETLNFDHYITLGSNTLSIDVTIANSNFSGGFNVNDTVVVFGDVYFENKSMGLNITSNGVFIVFGNLTMNNKISINSDGLIVVTETFAMTGSSNNNDYSGTGNVYAGAYGGNAETEIDASGDGNNDSSFGIDQLSNDGYAKIEEFVTGSGSVPLPVELLFFKVDIKNQVNLYWATASETNNDYFSVDRSEDGRNFYEIGTVKGNGNSSETITYSFQDYSLINEVTFYRLRQIDFNGVNETFEAIRVETDITLPGNVTIFPTVVRNGILKINAPSNYIKDLTIYGLNGRRYDRLNLITLSARLLQTQIPPFPTGNYLIQIRTFSNETLRYKVKLE